MESLSARKRNPWIVLTPYNFNWATYLPEQRFHLCGIALISLRKLPVKATSTIIGQPRCDKSRNILAFDVVDDRALNVSLNNRLVDVRRKAQKRIHVPADMIKKLRSPRAHRNDVHEHAAVKLTAMQQVRAKGRGTTKIVRDDFGPVQAPKCKHFGEDPSLNIQSSSFLRLLVGSAIPRHVVPVNAIMLC